MIARIAHWLFDSDALLPTLFRFFVLMPLLHVLKTIVDLLVFLFFALGLVVCNPIAWVAALVFMLSRIC